MREDWYLVRLPLTERLPSEYGRAQSVWDCRAVVGYASPWTAYTPDQPTQAFMAEAEQAALQQAYRAIMEETTR